jgi:hypothetical protein
MPCLSARSFASRLQNRWPASSVSAVSMALRCTHRESVTRWMRKGSKTGRVDLINHVHREYARTDGSTEYSVVLMPSQSAGRSKSNQVATAAGRCDLRHLATRQTAHPGLRSGAWRLPMPSQSAGRRI